MCLSRCSVITSEVVDKELTQCTFFKQEMASVRYVYTGMTSLTDGFIPDQTQILNRAKLLSKDQMKLSLLSIAKIALAAKCLDHKTQLQELHKNCVNQLQTSGL